MLAAFIDHLWPSTLLVVLAWVLTRLLRKNGAHVRYCIWWAASLKFLVPWSLLSLIGNEIGESVMAVGPVGSLSGTVQQVAAPFVAPATFITLDSHGPSL